MATYSANVREGIDYGVYDEGMDFFRNMSPARYDVIHKHMKRNLKKRKVTGKRVRKSTGGTNKSRITGYSGNLSLEGLKKDCRRIDKVLITPASARQTFWGKNENNRSATPCRDKAVRKNTGPKKRKSGLTGFAGPNELKGYTGNLSLEELKDHCEKNDDNEELMPVADRQAYWNADENESDDVPCREKAVRKNTGPKKRKGGIKGYKGTLSLAEMRQECEANDRVLIPKAPARQTYWADHSPYDVPCRDPPKLSEWQEFVKLRRPYVIALKQVIKETDAKKRHEMIMGTLSIMWAEYKHKRKEEDLNAQIAVNGSSDSDDDDSDDDDSDDDDSGDDGYNDNNFWEPVAGAAGVFSPSSAAGAAPKKKKNVVDADDDDDDDDESFLVAQPLAAHARRSPTKMFNDPPDFYDGSDAQSQQTQSPINKMLNTVAGIVNTGATGAAGAAGSAVPIGKAIAKQPLELAEVISYALGGTNAKDVAAQEQVERMVDAEMSKVSPGSAGSGNVVIDWSEWSSS